MTKYLVSYFGKMDNSIFLGDYFISINEDRLTEETIEKIRETLKEKEDIKEISFLNIIRLEDSNDTRSTTSDSDTRERTAIL